jgi:hypothetical protein
MDNKIELLEKNVDILKRSWTLENETVSKKLKVVEDLVSGGDYTDQQLKSAIADVRAVIESVEPWIKEIEGA